jgi:DNA-directed RNA polymerase subunit RPC12/RpoP
MCASCGWEGKHEREDGDRICPNCETLNLVEESLTKWKCLKCQKTYDEEWLDEGIEIED